MSTLGFDLFPGTTMVVATATDTSQWELSSILNRDDGMQMGALAACRHYGRSLFEGMKAHRTKDGQVALFRPRAHAQRMYQAAQAFGLKPVDIDFFLNVVMLVVQENHHLIPEYGKGSLYIRPLLEDAGEVMGLSSSGKYQLQVTANPVGEYFSGGLQGVHLFRDPLWFRTAPGLGGNLKLSANYGQGIPRKVVAQQHGCAEIIYNRHGTPYVDECGAMNLFFFKKGALYTPGLQWGTVLPGITRDSVIQLVKYWGMRVYETDIHINTPYDEAFGTGTAAVVTPVLGWRQENGTEMAYSSQVGPLTVKVYRALTNIQCGKASDLFNWLEYVAVD